MAGDRPTFHESWYRIAGLRPRLRSAVQTYRQHFRGRTWHVLQDPSANQHFRVDDAGYFFVAMLDGRRTVEEVWRVCNEQLGDEAPTQGEVINLLGQLYSSNLLMSDLPADATGMFENYRRKVRREIGGFFKNLLFVRIPLFDPDRILDRWVRFFGPLMGPFGFVLWVGLLGAAFWQLAGHGEELVSGVSGVLAPENLFLLYITFAVVKAVHEFGHGFACKRYGIKTGSGGEVHVMGIMLLVFTPVPYVDASSAWAFRSRWQRAFVGAAGMYVELALAAMAAIVWVHTSPGVVNSVAYNMIFIASVSTLLFNGNPLLRFDGYYILSDLLEVPNLARRSREYLCYLVRRWVYGVKKARPMIRGRGERFWLPLYGIASTIYRVIIFAGIILFVADKFFFIGAMFAIAGITSWVAAPLYKFVRYLATAPELSRVRPRAITISVLFFVLLIGGLGFVPAPDRARAEGVVEPRVVAAMYTRESGFVTDVVASGTRVDATAPLVSADNLEMLVARDRVEAERRLTIVRRNQASIDEVALAQSLTQRLGALDEQMRRLDERIAALRLRAPIDGVWISPQYDRMPSAYVDQGAPVGLVAGLEDLIIRAVADQRLGPRIEPEIGRGGNVEIRVKGRPDMHFEGSIRDVLPGGSRQLPSAALGYMVGGSTRVDLEDESGTAAVEPFFEVLIDPEGETPPLHSGQRVVVRFDAPSRPLAVQWWRALRQLVQRRFQI